MQMIRRVYRSKLQVAILVFVFLAFAVSLSMNVVVTGASVYVPVGQSIQEAINNAVDGDTIIVQNGIHAEAQYPVVVNKSVTLVGQDSVESVINGNGTNRGILLVKANGARVFNLTIQNTTENFAVCGISLGDVKFVQVDGCILSNCGSGIGLTNSSENNITRNNIVNNKSFGVYLHATSSFNVFSGNNVTANPTGINIADTLCQHNMFYHNNFVANTNQQSGSGMSNGWDYGYPSGGNYWDDHTNEDLYSGIGQNLTGSDGIADASYNDRDMYPLAELVHVFYMYEWNQLDYYAFVSSNSPILDFQFDSNVDKGVVFKVMGFVGGGDCCRVVLPKSIMWVESGESWIVTVNGTAPPASPLILEDAYNSYFFLLYGDGTQVIRIRGTHVVTEYSLLALALLLAFSVAGLILVMESKEHAGLVAAS